MNETNTGYFEGNYDGRSLIISIKAVSGIINRASCRDRFTTSANVLPPAEFEKFSIKSEKKSIKQITL